MGLKESGGSQDGWQLGLGPEYRARTWSRGVRVTGSGLQWSTFRIYSPLRSGKADTAGETRAPPGLPPKSGDMGTLWREAVRRRDLREGSRNATSRAFSTKVICDVRPKFLHNPCSYGWGTCEINDSPRLSVCMRACLVISDSLQPYGLARQAPLSMGFFRQEYWSGLPCPPPGDLPDPGIEPASLMSPALAGGS